MKLTRPQLITVLVTAVAAIALAIVIILDVTADEPVDNPTATRENSHVLDRADDDQVTLVEFLDFECEACGAAYPFVESLREKYAGKITFVVRYFPIESHPNAINAAHAAEAAARQGEFEPMYQKLFSTQPEWSHQNSSQADVFRGYAEELGLDLDQFDADVASDEVAERVQQDFDDGRALDVSGTPTFFLNGKKLEVESEQEFYDAIDAALGETAT